MTVLVIAEHDNSSLNAATLNTITAAAKIDKDVHVLVAGKNAQKAADEVAKASGVSKVLLADGDGYEHALAENLAWLVKEIAQSYTHILAPSNTFGKNFMPRAAALLDVAQVTDVIEIISDDTFKRPIYAGNAIATVQSSDKIKLLTVRGTAFESAILEGGASAVEAIDAQGNVDYTRFVSVETTESDRPDLTSARIVISGGRAFGSEEKFNMLNSLAEKLGDCAIGASRAAVDAGYAPNDYQVGQTGKIVAPELYVAIGISGAIQHLAGMKDSKIIVAINTDENAPIFEIADYGLVADLFDALPEFESKIG